MMLNFDAAERHTCIVKRQKTSTPLQALVTLNDPQFVEAARVLAQRTLVAYISTSKTKMDMLSFPDVLIQAMFKAVLSRPARPVEVGLLKKLYSDELLSFKNEPKRAKALLKVGEYPIEAALKTNELAAWTLVVSTVMNMDEALVKR